MQITLFGQGLMADQAEMLQAAAHQVTIVNREACSQVLDEVTASQVQLVNLCCDEFIISPEQMPCARAVAVSHYAYCDLLWPWSCVLDSSLLVKFVRFPAALQSHWTLLHKMRNFLR
jgi:hypothetical protein